MRAMRLKNGQLQAADLPRPQPAAGEVLIQVAYAGVNRADLLQAEGKYPLPSAQPQVLGLEVSGEVAAVGKGVPSWKEGDKVAALLLEGGYAEYALADARHVFSAGSSQGKEFQHVAALPEAMVTYWLALKEKANLQPEERVLIHAGASGIGLTGIQLARLWGAQVITTAGGPEKCAACVALGATAIDYHSGDVVTHVMTWSEGKGVDVLIDILGGAYIEHNLAMLAQGGRMVSLAFMGGARTTDSLGPLLLKNLSWHGMTVRSQSAAKKAAIIHALAAEAWPLAMQGKITPVIDSVFPLEEAEKAHARMRDRLHCGKILLEVKR